MDKAKEKLILQPIDTYFLARAIIYYSIKQTPTITITEILNQYKITFYSKAEKYLNNKFNIKFNNLIQLEKVWRSSIVDRLLNHYARGLGFKSHCQQI